jgi:hypothetical protein
LCSASAGRRWAPRHEDRPLDPYWNELDDEGRDFYPRLYVLDNVDPATFEAFLERVELRKTLFNVVSKSGGTAETMSQYLIVRDRLQAELGDGYRRHFLFTTDPEGACCGSSPARRRSPRCPFPVTWADVSPFSRPWGCCRRRWWGSTSASCWPARATWTNAARRTSCGRNPAGLFAALQYLADTGAGAPIHVMMPYSDRLRDVADWFRQLWAESLGKRASRDGEEVFVGPTPVKALGATDQHSQVQLYMEGPFDKTITFLAERDPGGDVQIPSAYRRSPSSATWAATAWASCCAPRCGDRGGAGRARAHEHDLEVPGGGRPLARRALHAAPDRHRVRRRLLRRGPAGPARAWSWGSSSPTGSWAGRGSTSTGRRGSGVPRETVGSRLVAGD